MARTELEGRTKRFALELINLVERMPTTKAADVVSRQLLRSGTSTGANYREANRAESADDFIHKIAISTKEASETEFWLEMINESQSLQTHGANALLIECRELIAILITIGKNAKQHKTKR